MARIKIKDLPKDAKVSREEMKKIRGGVISSTSYVGASPYPVLTPKLPPLWGQSPMYVADGYNAVEAGERF
jgi:hypothetical protein